ncbi:MAG: YjjG family noncanonical pyrimidine nucleotidase [Bacteroidales bacterium]|nr:YjjG family noncanonical pyrimidine nucleotidase [Bacteroidales bacterium]
MGHYIHLFFDLDGTLWDFKANARAALSEIFNNYSLHSVISDFDLFVDTYAARNEILWEKYRKGLIKKEFLRSERFRKTLAEFNIYDEQLVQLIGDSYIALSPAKTIMVPHTLEILEYLHKRYSLYIITNGFKEVQHQKLDNCGLTGFFKKVFTSDGIGFQKPRTEIFNHSLSAVHARKSQSLMIGDDLDVDILGAKKAGIDQVYFNPNGENHNFSVTFEINTLLELKKIL